MKCLVKYLEAINHVNNTNMFSQEFTDNIELQGKSSVRSLSYSKGPRSLPAYKNLLFLSVNHILSVLLLAVKVGALPA